MNTIIEKAKGKAKGITAIIDHVNSNLTKKVDNAGSYLDKAGWKITNSDSFTGHEGKPWSEGWDKGWSKWGK